MKKVSIREFRANMAKWLKCVPLTLTRNGNDVYTITKAGEESVHNPQIDLNVGVHKSVNAESMATYGCGCKRTDDKPCKKHGRV